MDNLGEFKYSLTLVFDIFYLFWNLKKGLGYLFEVNVGVGLFSFWDIPIKSDLLSTIN